MFADNMKRRLMLKRLGIASVGAAGLAGNASAHGDNGGTVLGDLTLDVSDVSGEVALTELATEEQLDQLDAETADDLDPRSVTLHIDRELKRAEEDVCCDMGCCYDYGGGCLPWCLCCMCNNLCA